MSQSATLRLELNPPIAEIVLDRPRQRNAVNHQMLDELQAALAATENDADVRVVLLRAEGPAFCAGNDMKERAGFTVEQVSARRRRGHEVLDALERHPRPCIAVVHGAAVAAGVELALCCDFILAGEAATFRYPEGVRGPGAGTRRLPARVGKAIAKELLYTGRTIDAHEAERLRLVNHVFPDDDLLAAARDMAATIARGRPVALSLTKRAIDTGIEPGPDDANRLEQEALEAALRFQAEHPAR
ncbi:MAG TPA: enoyl-CoA hydratase/isomerase family protein [Nitrolancea sp.]|nr:enoyl-CoA hydratase/isomerase family protein [Nitrolancea sp.]